MVSGLRVNFHKSCLMGVNVSEEFLVMASTFLNCKVGLIPFMYLGLPVGANPKKLSTWEPVLERISAKFSSWRNRYISLGGRIVLLNSVLNSIPIFYLSYLKMPVRVIKKVEGIQRRFLWGGVGGPNKICWVKWRKICQPKSKGGLGVRDIKLVNLSLLAKWKWRLLEDEPALWREVLDDIYGPSVSFRSRREGEVWGPHSSHWWKDLMGLEEVGDVRWFRRELERGVGDGLRIFFWKDVWMGNMPLMEVYPRLFSLAINQDVVVGDLCASEVGGDVEV